MNVRDQVDTSQPPGESRARRVADGGQARPRVDAQAPPSAVAADRPERLRVLLIPDAPRNPYQRRLTNGLEALGVRVELARPGGPLPLLQAVRRHGPVQVLHLHWTHHLVLGRTRTRTVVKAARFLAELALLRLRGVRVVWTAHNLVEHERRQPRLELLCGRLAAHLYDAIIVHCSAAGRAVTTAYRQPPRARAKLHVIPHGHFIDAYPQTATRAEARRRLGLTGAGPVFVHFGQIRGYKGVDELLAAFARLQAPEARLVIAGKPWDDATAAGLEALARKDRRVLLALGFVPDSQVQLYLAAADAMVLPFRGILTSGSAMLAMSFGRAVITPRCGCMEEMLGGEGGVLYDAAEAGALEQALCAAAGTDLDAMGRRGRRRAETFDWERIAVRTLAAYEGWAAR